jgi:hypothetical protein
MTKGQTKRGNIHHCTDFSSLVFSPQWTLVPGSMYGSSIDILWDPCIQIGVSANHKGQGNVKKTLRYESWTSRLMKKIRNEKFP